MLFLSLHVCNDIQVPMAMKEDMVFGVA